MGRVLNAIPRFCVNHARRPCCDHWRSRRASPVPTPAVLHTESLRSLGHGYGRVDSTTPIRSSLLKITFMSASRADGRSALRFPRNQRLCRLNEFIRESRRPPMASAKDREEVMSSPLALREREKPSNTNSSISPELAVIQPGSQPLRATPAGNSMRQTLLARVPRTGQGVDQEIRLFACDLVERVGGIEIFLQVQSVLADGHRNALSLVLDHQC